MAQRKTVLILGASGGIGGAIAAALLRHGWQVRGMARDVMSAKHRANPHIEGARAMPYPAATWCVRRRASQ